MNPDTEKWLASYYAMLCISTLSDSEAEVDNRLLKYYEQEIEKLDKYVYEDYRRIKRNISYMQSVRKTNTDRKDRR